MSKTIHNGVWPTMITPFTEDHTPDFPMMEKMCRWYIEKGCTGIFAVCQSSEMAFLTEQQKLDIAKCVVDACNGEINVVASGHTADDKATQFREIENMVKIKGLDAYVLVSNRLDQMGDDENAFQRNVEEILDRFPEVDFGIYECPIPFKRLVSLPFLRWAGQSGRIVFLKDTCCDYELIRQRLDAVRGTPLKIFNANAASFYDSFVHGGAGYSGIMANYHPDLYKWVIDHNDTEPERAKLLADFLTEFAMIEMRLYPTSAKYHMAFDGMPMSLYARSADMRKFDKNARMEADSLRACEVFLRQLYQIR